MSAIEIAINLSYDKNMPKLYNDATSELSQLRADIDAAQRERDEARAQLREIDELIDPLDGQTLLEAVSYLIHDDGEPLTPRRCVTCAQEAAREMREKCINKAETFFAYRRASEWAKTRTLS